MLVAVISIVVILLAIGFVLFGLYVNRTVGTLLLSPRVIPEKRPNNSHQEFQIDVDGSRINGWIVNKQDPSKDIAIIFAPGYMGSKNFMAPILDFFADQGFVSVSFDPRGEGESEGEVYALGALEDEDIEAVMKYLKETKGITKFVLFGFSCGATASIVAASRHPEEVVAVIADSPFANIVEARKKGLLGVLWVRICNLFAHLKTGIDIYKETNALAVVDKVSGIFLIHGKNDRAVNYHNSVMLYHAAQEPKEIWLVDNSDHAQAVKLYTDTYLQKVLNFINQQVVERSRA
jgi:hypothetical protein